MSQFIAGGALASFVDFNYQSNHPGALSRFWNCGRAFNHPCCCDGSFGERELAGSTTVTNIYHLRTDYLPVLYSSLVGDIKGFKQTILLCLEKIHRPQCTVHVNEYFSVTQGVKLSFVFSLSIHLKYRWLDLILMSDIGQNFKNIKKQLHPIPKPKNLNLHNML